MIQFEATWKKNEIPLGPTCEIIFRGYFTQILRAWNPSLWALGVQRFNGSPLKKGAWKTTIGKIPFRGYVKLWWGGVNDLIRSHLKYIVVYIIYPFRKWFHISTLCIFFVHTTTWKVGPEPIVKNGVTWDPYKWPEGNGNWAFLHPYTWSCIPTWAFLKILYHKVYITVWYFCFDERCTYYLWSRPHAKWGKTASQH